MNPQHGPPVADIYQSDLERHLFAPGRKRRRHRVRRRSFDPVSDRLRNWFLTSWARWKQLAEAA